MRGTLLENLGARLEAAARRQRNYDGMVTALADLDPAGLADCLSELGEADVASLSQHVQAHVLSALTDALVSEPESIASAKVVDLLWRHRDTFHAPSAGRLAMAVGPGSAESERACLIQHLVTRAPNDSDLLRSAAEIQIAAGNHAEAHAVLTRLGQVDRSLATVQWIHRVRRALRPADAPAVRIALLSSFTLDPLLGYLDIECRALGLAPEIYLAPFNSWAQEILAEDSPLRQIEPELAILAVAADDMMTDLAAAPTAAALEAAAADAVEHILELCAHFASWSHGVLVVHSLYSVFRDPAGIAAGRESPSRAEVLNAANARLAQGLRELPRTYLLDLSDLLLRRRTGAVENPKMRHLARMRLGEHVLPEIARAYADYVAPSKGLTRKCVVVDLDNTLWGGIVGEDGLHGIRLGDTSPGSEYREFQVYLRSLSERGILLAINSKNNPEDALEVIRSHEAMVLREDAFAAMRINWDPKPENMMGLADELNIGLDSLVFVDDSDKERELMRQVLPQVLTPDLPKDPARYREALESLPQLNTLTVTQEDRSRTRQYRELGQRKELRISSQSVDGYLHSLGIITVIEPVSERTLPRVHQLFQRTNQFNLTGKRYELGTLTQYVTDATWRMYAARVSDRFGDHGLVATALVRAGSHEWFIENFVMSCRVIGYGVEGALIAQVSVDAHRAGVERLCGEFVRTAKNVPARNFYAAHGFERDPEDTDEEREQWQRSVTEGGASAPDWIEVKVNDGT